MHIPEAMSVRVRFAPSPTGPLHIGGLRTALYNYLFARQHGGTFILRIEDTDQTRYVPGAEEYIVEALNWSGLHPDESPAVGGAFGPYRQSERKDIYAQHAQLLIASGHAYYAFDTPDEIEAMRTRLKAAGEHSPKYDQKVRMQMRNSLTLSTDEVAQLLEKGVPYTIRLKVPENQQVEFTDTVRGDITFNTDELDDKVLLKTGGLPTYHLANVVDDRLMQISHVIRGEEWLSSTAHHVMLYRAFGWVDQMPVFAHLPLILKPSGQGKLSKRDGAKFGFPVFPLDWQDDTETYPGFREFGFLPEALLNFLAFLGWNPGTEEEVFSLEQLTSAFSLDKITKSGARFDFDKALWYNSQYLQAMDDAELAAQLRPLLSGQAADNDMLKAIAALYKDRVNVVTDIVQQASYLFSLPASFDETIVRKKWTPEMAGHFAQLRIALEQVEVFDADVLQETIEGYIQENGLKFGEVLQLLRCSVSGSHKGPDVFAMLALLGKDEVIERIDSGIERFSQQLTTDHHG